MTRTYIFGIVYLFSAMQVIPSTQQIPSDTQVLANVPEGVSTGRFVEVTHDYVAALKQEYDKALRNFTHDALNNYVAITPPMEFIIDLEQLRTNYQDLNNVWLQALHNAAKKNIADTHTLFNNPKDPSHHHPEVYQEEERRINQKTNAAIDKYLQEFNVVYQHCHWHLVYDQESQQFILIDRLAKEFESTIKKYLPTSPTDQQSRENTPTQTTSPQHAADKKDQETMTDQMILPLTVHPQRRSMISSAQLPSTHHHRTQSPNR